MTYIKRCRPGKDSNASGLTSLQIKILGDSKLSDWTKFMDILFEYKGGLNTNLVVRNTIQNLVSRGLLVKEVR